VLSRGGSDGLGWVEAAGASRRIEPGECPEHKGCAHADRQPILRDNGIEVLVLRVAHDNPDAYSDS
jgi:hypothetical protein